MKWIPFYLTAKTSYDLHAPAVTEFVREVLEDRRQYYAFPSIEHYRRMLRSQDTWIDYPTQGAKSQIDTRQRRTLSEIVRHSAVSPDLGRLLFRCVRSYQPDTILELGSAAGLSALYQTAAAPRATFRGIEGNVELAAIANAGLQQMGLAHARVLAGRFQELLPELLRELGQLDLVFIDGDHTEEATLQLWEMISPALSKTGIVILADPYWSKGMQKAWQEISRRERVRLSIDLFEAGLLFMDPRIRHKQHYALVRSAWKPWHLGFTASS